MNWDGPCHDELMSTEEQDRLATEQERKEEDRELQEIEKRDEETK